MRQPIATLSKISQPDRESALDNLVRAAREGKPNGSLSALDGQIREFETRYEMTSTELVERYRRREVADTADVARWLMLVSVRNRVRR